MLVSNVGQKKNIVYLHVGTIIIGEGEREEMKQCREPQASQTLALVAPTEARGGGGGL